MVPASILDTRSDCLPADESILVCRHVVGCSDGRRWLFMTGWRLEENNSGCTVYAKLSWYTWHLGGENKGFLSLISTWPGSSYLTYNTKKVCDKRALYLCPRYGSPQDQHWLIPSPVKTFRRTMQITTTYRWPARLPRPLCILLEIDCRPS